MRRCFATRDAYGLGIVTSVGSITAVTESLSRPASSVLRCVITDSMMLLPPRTVTWRVRLRCPAELLFVDTF